jgi:hypothetical protein
MPDWSWPGGRSKVSRARRSGAARALRFAALAALAGSAACGGGDGAPPPSYETKAGACASPRTGLDPGTGTAYPDRPGTPADEKAWVRGWIDDLYLWYREVPDVDPQPFGNATDYFMALKTQATAPDGRPKDRFHYWYPTDVWQQMSAGTVEAGYGVRWIVVRPTPPREVIAAFAEPGKPGALAGIGRGARVLAVDGTPVDTASDIAALGAGLWPARAGEAHVFSVLDRGATAPRNLTLTSVAVPQAPVMNVRTLAATGGAVGYLQFNHQMGSAEAALVEAIGSLRAAAVTDLVVDMRYNLGGLVGVAGELAYEVAGPARSAGRAFARIAFNHKHPELGGVVPFVDRGMGLSVPASTSLPHLDLGRVFVLTGPETCSASELVLNGLRGIDLAVVQVGEATCGKPWGFLPRDNCGTTYFAINFEVRNEKGFGDYEAGFVPGGAGGAGLPGCRVQDDFAHDLGDPAEALLAAALAFRESGTCPPAASPLRSGGGPGGPAGAAGGAGEALAAPPGRAGMYLH